MPEKLQPGWRPLAFILALTALIYSQSLRFGFVYDDPLQIINNPRIAAWSYVPSYFQHHNWFQISETGSYYRPLFLLFLRIVYWLFGSNAVLWHATVIVLHLAAIAAIYALLRRTIDDAFTVIVATSIFAVHPAHIESVAWISGLTDPLMTVPLIGSLLVWLHYRESKKIFWLAAALGLFVIALMVKETAAITPLLAFVYSYALNRDEKFPTRVGNALRAFAAYLLVFAAYWAVRWQILKPEFAPPVRPASAAIFNLPAMGWFYLQHLVWPAHLSVIYDFDLMSSGPLFAALLISAIVLAAGILAARRSSTLFLAWAWIVLPIAATIAATSTFDPHDFVHDRYLYLPALGLGILIAEFLRRFDVGTVQLFGRPTTQILASVLVVCSLAYGTESQLAPWADNLTLFTHAVQSAPNNPLAYEHLAFEVYRRGDTATAIRLYEKSVALDPNDWHANFGLAVMLYRTQQWQAADEYCGRANQISPTANNACYQFQTVARMNLGQNESAEVPIRFAIAQWPRATGQYLLLGRILEEEGKPSAAAQAFQQELQLDPNSADARSQLDRLSVASVR